MSNDLTTSALGRQNILNNPFAVVEIEKAIGIRGIPFEGQRYVLLDQVAFFFQVHTRTIERTVKSHAAELEQNGYRVLRSNALEQFKKTLFDTQLTDIDVGKLATAPKLSVFNFRALINIAMLLTDSDRAKLLRQAILDIAIDTINVRTGGATKYVNQRDEQFLERAFHGESYRKEFTDALSKFVEMGSAKYPIYTDKIYESIFKEKSRLYRKILNLEERDRTRDTFYSEILTLISSYECGIADEIKKKSESVSRKLDPWEVDEVFKAFSDRSHWRPLLEHARIRMASRDMALRGVKHDALEDYISPLPADDFERFLGEQSKQLDKRLEDAKEVLKRLKDR